MSGPVTRATFLGIDMANAESVTVTVQGGGGSGGAGGTGRAILRGISMADGTTMYECSWRDCGRRFDTVTDLNRHEAMAHTPNPLSMDRASDRDREAVKRLLGLPDEPVNFEPIRIVGSFRNGKSPERKAPTDKDRMGFRMWKVPSSSSDTIYTVVERVDTKSDDPKGTYFFCDCPSWPTQRGRGQDCKHIKEVIA